MLNLDRFRGFLGIVAILGLAFALSNNRRAISRRVVFWGLALQWAFAGVVLWWRPGAIAPGAGRGVHQGRARDGAVGSEFVFGPKLVAADGPAGFVFAFRVLPTVIFVAALFAVLYHLGIMQWVVRGFATRHGRNLMGASGAESLNVAASLFLGQTEAPLDDPAVPAEPDPIGAADGDDLGHGARLGRGDGGLFRLRRRAPAHPDGRDHDGAGDDLAGEDARPRDRASPRRSAPFARTTERPDANVLDAASRGTREGLRLALNIAAMLISFLALIALVNKGLGDRPGTLVQTILGRRLAPVAFLLGVPDDCRAVGGLLGTRTVLNELIAFGELGAFNERVAPASSFTIATFALCGFANFSSIGIQLGGIGALAPERRGDLARLGLPGAARGHARQLPLGLHRGDLAMIDLRPLRTGRRGRPRRSPSAIADLPRDGRRPRFGAGGVRRPAR